jgi:5-methylcytosine-specific restriction enzyme A
MTRTLPEWKGRTHDEAIPPRVKVRIFERFEGRCAICTLTISGKLRPAYDHIIALCNGGENRESNLQLLCVPDHAIKTGKDVALKSVTARKRGKHLGIVTAKHKIQSRGFAKSTPQRTASRPIERRS